MTIWFGGDMLHGQIWSRGRVVARMERETLDGMAEWVRSMWE